MTQTNLQSLAEKIANPKWQKVVKQLVKSQQPADRLLRLIKQSIDHSISGNLELNRFLGWVLQKAGSAQVDYKPTVLRAIYFTLDLDCALGGDLNRAIALDRDRALSRDRARDRAHNLDFALSRDRARDRALARVLARALGLACDLDSDFAFKLEQLRTELPSLKDRQYFQQWWKAQGQQWLERLRQVMIDYRNISHGWQFTEAQEQQLRRYYDANRFLAKLMNIEGAVSQEVRAEIENNLLLPWDELQRRHLEA